MLRGVGGSGIGDGDGFFCTFCKGFLNICFVLAGVGVLFSNSGGWIGGCDLLCVCVVLCGVVINLKL